MNIDTEPTAALSELSKEELQAFSEVDSEILENFNKRKNFNAQEKLIDLYENVDDYNIYQILKNFQKEVSRLKQNKKLSAFLSSKSLLNALVENTLVSVSDFDFLLKHIDNEFELNALLKSTKNVLKHLLETSLLKSDVVSSFKFAQNIFDQIRSQSKADNELIELSQFSQYVCQFDAFDFKNRQQLLRALTDDAKLFESVKFVVESNLHRIFNSFGDLKEYLNNSDAKLSMKNSKVL